MEKGRATRQRILESGLAIMSEAGLGAVTFGGLAERVGMSKSGLFAHFESKDEVQLELLDHTVELAGACVVEPAMQEPEGLPRLDAVARRWIGWAQRAGLPGGCPVAAGLFEFDDVASPVRDRIVELEAGWRAMLRRLVVAAVRRGELRGDLDPDQFVWELSGIYLAHHVAQRLARSDDADRRALTAYEALVARSQS